LRSGPATNLLSPGHHSQTPGYECEVPGHEFVIPGYEYLSCNSTVSYFFLYSFTILTRCPASEDRPAWGTVRADVAGKLCFIGFVDRVGGGGDR
jgi:hypothetical protein